ncbi:MAG: DNA integrity scanning protein DisA nucleotide-binding domain protein [Desulfobulbus sp.]|jgi:hypothetical protein
MIDKAGYSFIRRCVSDIINGLSEGFTHFSGASRAAVVFALGPDSPLMICDPQNLLQGHEPIFKQLFLQDESWRYHEKARIGGRKFIDVLSVPNLGLAGLLSSGGYSSPVFFQFWFTEHHPNLCSTGPSECWLEHALWRFAHDVANGVERYSGISGYFLKEYATHAVRDHIIDRMNRLIGWDTPLRIYPVLDAVLMISETREEGSWPEGRLLFIDPRLADDLDYLIRFNEEMRPQLSHYRHVRKMLQSVEHANRYLVSDGRAILGICGGQRPAFSVSAEFFGRRGFLRVNSDKICSFSDGRFSSSNYRPTLVQLEELLLECDLEQTQRFYLFSIVTGLVYHAQRHKHGCTIVLDLNKQPEDISGYVLKPPLDLRKPYMLHMTKALAKVDGALHIGADLHLHGFASLLDGRTYTGEDRARGARYNSALRYSHEHQNVIVVVVSADLPVSVLYRGMDMDGACAWQQYPGGGTYQINTLEQWVL